MAVLADQLTQAGDPRGPLMAVQLALEDRPADPRLLKEEARLLSDHARTLLGPVRRASGLCELAWHRGYIVGARIVSHTTIVVERRGVHHEPPSRVPRAVRALLGLGSACCLERLEVMMAADAFGTAQLLEAAEAVAAAPRRPRQLRVAWLPRYEDDELTLSEREEQLDGVRLTASELLFERVKAALE